VTDDGHRPPEWTPKAIKSIEPHRHRVYLHLPLCPLWFKAFLSRPNTAAATDFHREGIIALRTSNCSTVTAQLCRARWLSMAVKQGRRIHHRGTKKKPGYDFSKTYRLRFSFSDSLCLCGESCLLEPVRSRPRPIKQIIPCGGDGRDTPGHDGIDSACSTSTARGRWYYTSSPYE
jgi:hypothetical protein